MPLITPVQYLRRRSAKKHSAKPTCLNKIATRPYINLQIGSPLFNCLPAEIRSILFEFALLAYQDPTKPFSPHSYHYRPGYTHARRIATNLLLTCRRIYLETHMLPISQNEHVLYGGEASHAPPSYRPYLFPTTSLRTVQRDAIRRVHLFAAQYWLEDWNEHDQWHDFCRSWSRGATSGPAELRVTVRHTDWWYYLLGEHSPLALDPRKAGRARTREEWAGGEDGRVRGRRGGFEEGSWGARFGYFRGLETFELELETLEEKRAELNAVVALAPLWRFALRDEGAVLVLDEAATERSQWAGSSHFKGLRVPDVEAGLQSPFVQGAGRRATFAGLRSSGRTASSTPTTTTAAAAGPLDAAQGLRNKLHYYVVLLTWRAHDSDDLQNEDSANEEGEAGEESETVAVDAGHGPAAQNGGAQLNRVTAALATGPARSTARNVIPSYWG